MEHHWVKSMSIVLLNSFGQLYVRHDSRFSVNMYDDEQDFVQLLASYLFLCKRENIFVLFIYFDSMKNLEEK